MKVNEQLVQLLREQCDALRFELRADPRFQEYEQVRLLLERYQEQVSSLLERYPEPPDRRAIGVRTETGMAAIVEAAADFLREKGSRAESSEIQDALVKRGIMEPGARDRGRVTSYLGRTKTTFDNVRGEGYGLVEWRKGRQGGPAG